MLMLILLPVLVFLSSLVRVLNELVFEERTK